MNKGAVQLIWPWQQGLQLTKPETDDDLKIQRAIKMYYSTGGDTSKNIHKNPGIDEQKRLTIYSG